MSESAEHQNMLSEERSRCWSSNVEDGSEEQASEGGWPSGITVTTEISIQPVRQTSPGLTASKFPTDSITDRPISMPTTRTQPRVRRMRLQTIPNRPRAARADLRG